MKSSVASRSVLAALLASICAGPSSGAERSLRLEEALRLALEHDESIVIQRESLAAAEAGVAGAAGAYDPLLGVEAAWREGRLPVNSSFSGAPEGRLAPSTEASEGALTLEQLLPTGGLLGLRAAGSRATTDGLFEPLSPAYQTRVGVELRQPLLRNLAIDPARLGIRVAASERAGAGAELERALAETLAAVERAYWTLVAARREVDVRAEAVRLAEEQLTETEARIETGAAPETEIAQPRAELERRRGELLASREAAIRAESSLKLLILGDGEPERWNERLAPTETLEVTARPVDLGAAMARALDSRPELARFAAAVERRRAESALARDALRPALDAVVSYDRYGLAGDANADAGTPGGGGAPPSELRGGLGDSLDLLRDGELDDTRVALVLSLPLGNRAARARAAAAASAEQQAAAELARQRKVIRAEVLDAGAALETAGQRIEAARSARAAAEVQLEAERVRYGSGLSTNFLVLTRQNDLSRARLDEIAAQTDYRRAETELARVTGNLLAERGVEIATFREPMAR